MTLQNQGNNTTPLQRPKELLTQRSTVAWPNSPMSSSRQRILF